MDKETQETPIFNCLLVSKFALILVSNTEKLMFVHFHVKLSGDQICCYVISQELQSECLKLITVKLTEAVGETVIEKTGKVSISMSSPLSSENLSEACDRLRTA